MAIVDKEKQTVAAEKLSGPERIPEPVAKYLIEQKRLDSEWVSHLKAVLHRNAKGNQAYDVRLFDEEEARTKNAPVKDYTSLDGHPEVTLYEGWFDKGSTQVDLKDGPGLVVKEDTVVFTKPEIWMKVALLTEPGRTVFFFLAGSPSEGGPLGRGAAVIELNPNYPGPKQKKYNIYTSNVVDNHPVGEWKKAFDTDKSKDIAAWVKDRHYMPTGR